MGKLDEKHIYECDICGLIVETKSKNIPPKWSEATFVLSNGYSSSTYLICKKHHEGQYTWKVKRKTAFQIMFEKCNPFKPKASK